MGKFRRIFFIAVLTGAGVIAFQLYWLNNAYKIQKDAFTASATNALQRSHDKYLMSYLEGGNKLKPEISFFETSDDTLMDQVKANEQYRLNTTSSADSLLNSTNLPKLEAILSDDFQKIAMRLLTHLFNKPYNKDSLALLYKQELATLHINLPFTLSLHDRLPTPVNNQVLVPTGSLLGPKAISVQFEGSSGYLLSRTATPIMISLLLMLLTAGCLWYMWRIISQQRLLADIKNDFIDNMTHELKTPISILKTTHEALHHFGGINNKEKTMRYLQLNITELNNLQQKVDRILDITQYESGKKILLAEQFNLKELLLDAIQRFNIDFKNIILLQFDLPDKFVKTDKQAIDTIINNLLDNAIKHNNKKIISITIEAALLHTDGLLLTVTDNGPGIAPDEQALIFDKFYRTGEGNLHTVKGFGIGLSYVKQLVTFLNGTVSVENEPGRGAKFIIQIPGICKG